MRRQLQFDFKKILYQRKYIGTYFVAFVLCSGYSLLLLTRGQTSFETFAKILGFFRPFCWLLVGYTLCDVLSSDYHDKNIKTYLPSGKSRICYLLSKVITAISYSTGLFVIQYLAVSIVCFSFQSSMENMSRILCLSILGNFSGVFFWVCLGALCVVLTESEAVTIGIIYAVLLLFFILEMVESFGKFLPTMWGMNVFLDSNSVVNNGWTLLFLGIALVSLLISLKIFHEKDIFL